MAKKDKAKPPPVTKDIWLAELEAAFAARRGASGGMTSKEIAAATGWSTNRVIALLQSLATQNRLIVTRETRPSLAGHYSTVPTYQLRAKAK